MAARRDATPTKSQPPTRPSRRAAHGHRQYADADFVDEKRGQSRRDGAYMASAARARRHDVA